MLEGTRRLASACVVGAGLAGSLIALAAADNTAKQSGEVQSAPLPALSTARPSGSRAWLQGFDPLRHHLEGSTLVADVAGSQRVELTLDAGLQQHLSSLYRRYEVPYGATVAIEPATGRVLAYVSHSSANPNAGDLVRDPTPPAASVFKVVTAAALVDSGVAPDTRICYSGGFRKLRAVDLIDNPKRDRSCATLGEAMGGSINTVFAKLADRHLDRPTLSRYAEAFGFGHALPFDTQTRPSASEVPGDSLEFARTAAGFWHMHMSPLHGALIASTIANGGVMARPSMVQRVVDDSGRVVFEHEAKPFRSVIGSATAGVLGQMMRRTVTRGTARNSFYDKAGRPFLPGIRAAGKTGSLSTERPFRAYSWWVGFAPQDKPQIAVAALVVNRPKWRIKGSYVAREALRYYLVERAAQLVKSTKVEAGQAPRASLK